MSYNKSVEMYLEAIYILENNHGHAHVVDIAEHLGITKPSVTKAMDKLKEEGLIDKENYGHINLTSSGKEAAEKVYHKHCIVTRFLKDSLDLSHKEASVNACRMEHIITDAMLEAIENYVGRSEE